MPIALGLAIDSADPAERLAQAREAESRGCESIWLDGSAGEDVFAALAHLAEATREVRLGTLAHALALRHPLVSAREIAALDRISGGRVEVGLADAGGTALAEAITVCKKLFCDPSVEHRGAHFSQDEIALDPRPEQRPWPRLHLGGASDEALDRAARMADGWLATGHTPASIAAPLAVIRARRTRAETLDGRFQVSVRAEPAGRSEFESWHEAGVDRLIVSISTLRRLG
jgi:alkanesulfonate monooxygenase SsuD/methylene tetrahydromethanopterin reductase-like flavin-dependent oxidoreductase (luciferase family)